MAAAVKVSNTSNISVLEELVLLQNDLLQDDFCSKCHKFFDGSLSEHNIKCPESGAQATANISTIADTRKPKTTYWVKCALHKFVSVSVDVLKNCQFAKGGCYFHYAKKS